MVKRHLAQPELKHVTSSYDARPMLDNPNGWSVEEMETYTQQLIPPIIQGDGPEQREGSTVQARFFTAKFLVSNYCNAPTIVSNPNAHTDAHGAAIPNHFASTVFPGGGTGITVKCVVTIWKPKLGESWLESASDPDSVTVPFVTSECYTQYPYRWHQNSGKFLPYNGAPQPSNLKCKGWNQTLPVLGTFGKGPFPVAQHGFWNTREYTILSQKHYNVKPFSTKEITISRRWGGTGKTINYQEQSSKTSVSTAGWSATGARWSTPTAPIIPPGEDTDAQIMQDTSTALCDLEDKMFVTLQFYNLDNGPRMGPACKDATDPPIPGEFVPMFATLPSPANALPYPLTAYHDGNASLPMCGYAFSSRFYYTDE